MIYTHKDMLDIKTFLYNDYYAKLRSNMVVNDNWYNQNVSIGRMGKNVTIYVPPTAWKKINSATNHLMQLGYKVNIPQWNNDAEDAKIRALLIKFFTAWLESIEKNYRVNLRRSVIKNLFKHDMGVLKLAYVHRDRPDFGKTIGKPNPDKVKELESNWNNELERTFPFVFKSVHPKNVMSDPEEPGNYLIEIYEQTVDSLRNNPLCKKWADKHKGLKPSTKKQCWQFWTPNQKQYFIESEPILEDKEIDGVVETNNYLGFIPYEMGHAGFGSDSPDDKPEEKFIGMLGPIISALKTEAQIKTALAHGVKQDVLARPTLDKQPEIGANFKPATELGEYDVINESMYKPRFINHAQVNSDVYRILGMVDSDEESITPRATTGEQTGATSGYQEASRAGHARVQWEGAAVAWESIVSRTCDKVLRIIKYIDQPVGILGNFPDSNGCITISPNKIEPELQHVYVRLEAETPEEKDRRITLGMRMESMQDRILSDETICEEYYGKNYTEESEKRLIEKAMKHPMVVQGEVGAALEHAGLSQYITAIEDEPEGKRTPNEQTIGKDMRNMKRDTGRGTLKSEEEEEPQYGENE